MYKDFENLRRGATIALKPIDNDRNRVFCKVLLGNEDECELLEEYGETLYYARLKEDADGMKPVVEVFDENANGSTYMGEFHIE